MSEEKREGAVSRSEPEVGRFAFSDVLFEVPPDWSDQGMITFTLPSPLASVKPNIIVTKERLPKPIPLKEYFNRIKESILKRGIRDFKVEEETEIEVDGCEGMRMICSWDVSAMKQMLASQQSEGPIPEIPPGQMVRQAQVTLVSGTLAINITGSFPADLFDTYNVMFERFVRSIRFLREPD